MSSKQGYTHPPLMYIGAQLLAAGLVWFGLHLPKRPPSINVDTATAPGLWRLRLFAFLATVAFFLASWAIPNMVPIPIVPVLVIVGLVTAGIWCISRWAIRAGWNVRHRLALASGVLFFFVLLSPIIEFFTRGAGRITTGQTFFGLFALGVLIFLAWWVKRRMDSSLIGAGQI